MVNINTSTFQHINLLCGQISKISIRKSFLIYFDNKRYNKASKNMKSKEKVVSLVKQPLMIRELQIISVLFFNYCEPMQHCVFISQNVVYWVRSKHSTPLNFQSLFTKIKFIQIFCKQIKCPIAILFQPLKFYYGE